MKKLLFIYLFSSLCCFPSLFAANLGYKIISGAQKEHLDGLLIKESGSDQELIGKTHHVISQSPELVGYQLGLSVFSQPMPEIPISVGAYLTRRDLGSRQESLELRGYQGGIELNIWLPHETVEPYFLIVGGFWGRTTLQGDYGEAIDNTLDNSLVNSPGNTHTYRFSGQSRLVKGGVGLRLHSTKQLSAYFQVDMGLGLSEGDMSYEGFSRDSAKTDQTLIMGEKESGLGLKRIILQSRVQSLSIGIDWL